MNNQNQQEDEKPKGRWVQCPDMPDGLLTVDDETPQKTPKEMKEVEYEIHNGNRRRNRI